MIASTRRALGLVLDVGAEQLHRERVSKESAKSMSLAFSDGEGRDEWDELYT